MKRALRRIIRLSRPALPVCALLCAAALCASPVAAQSLWELTPYKVQVLVAVEDTPRLTQRAEARLREFLAGRIESLVGASWNANVTAAAAPLSIAMLGGLEHVATEDLPKPLLEADKVLLVSVGATPSGANVQARELDCRTRQWGVVVGREVPQPALLESLAMDAMLAAFAPLAQVDKVDGKQVSLKLRAANLPLRDPTALAIVPGTLFRPVLRFNDREGNLRADRPPQPIPWTYLLAREVTSNTAECEIFTGLRSPLSARRRGRSEQLALVVRPPERPTRLIVHSRVDPNRRLYGYEVYSYGPDAPQTTLLGRTDSRGAVMVPPSENALQLLIIKSGGEFLARLPLVPGIEPEVTAGVPNDDDRLAVEGYITGLQEEIVDLVARRATLVARIRAQIDAEKLDEAQQLLSQLRELRTREQLGVVLNEQRRKYFSSDAVVRRKVDKLFNDTREVMVRNLDPSLIDQVASEVDQALKARPAASPPAAQTSSAQQQTPDEASSARSGLAR